MVSSGVVWCLKNDQWVPLQLSSIILRGALTKAQWSAISDFLEMVASHRVVVQDTGNGLTGLSDDQKAVMRQQMRDDKLNLKLTDQQEALLSQLSQQNVQFCVQKPNGIVEETVEKTPMLDEVKCDKNVIQFSEQKCDQWQNLVIQDNGLIKLLNGKTDLDASHHENLDSENKKLELDELCAVEKLNNGQISSASTEPKQQMLMLQFQENKNEVNNSNKDSKVEDKTLPAMILANDKSILVNNNSNLFINNLFQQTDSNNILNIGRFVMEQKVDNSEQSSKKQNTTNDNTDVPNPKKSLPEDDEIVAHLLQKYQKYNQHPLNEELLNSLQNVEEISLKEETENKPKIEDKKVSPQRTRKIGSQHDPKLCEVFTTEHFDNERNEHVLRWLKEQNHLNNPQINQIDESKNDCEIRDRKLSVPCGTILGGRRVSIGGYPPKSGFRRTSVPSSIPRSRKTSADNSKKTSGIFNIQSIPEGIKSNHESSVSNRRVGWLSAPQSRKTSSVTPPDNQKVSSGNMKEKRRFSVISFTTSNNDKKDSACGSSTNSSPDCSKSRKDSIISTSSSRKGSVISNSSFSEDLELDTEEETLNEEETKKKRHWSKLLKINLGKHEKKNKKKDLNERKISSESETYFFLASEP